jgi:hypothetical protein
LPSTSDFLDIPFWALACHLLFFFGNTARFSGGLALGF